jgi:hypothetical protein
MKLTQSCMSSHFVIQIRTFIIWLIEATGGDSSGGQQDVGHEGVATRCGALSLCSSVRQIRHHKRRVSGGDGLSLTPWKHTNISSTNQGHGLCYYFYIVEVKGSRADAGILESV